MKIRYYRIIPGKISTLIKNKESKEKSEENRELKIRIIVPENLKNQNRRAAFA